MADGNQQTPVPDAGSGLPAQNPPVIPVPAPIEPVPQATTQPPEGQQATGQPQFITTAEAQRLIDEATERTFRRAQGLVGKTVEGINKKVTQELTRLNGLIKTQRESGVQISPEQEAALKTKVVDQVYAEAGNELGTGLAPVASEAQTGTEAAPPDPKTALAWNIMDAYKTEIDANDPEAQSIDWNGGDKRIIETTLAAIQAKQTRLAGTPNQTPATPVTPTNLVGGGTIPNTLANMKDPNEVWGEVRRQGKI